MNIIDDITNGVASLVMHTGRAIVAATVGAGLGAVITGVAGAALGMGTMYLKDWLYPQAGTAVNFFAVLAGGYFGVQIGVTLGAIGGFTVYLTRNA